ncbi:MAG: hypothetical protein AB7D36_05570 [Oscillospiraceae bacterium]
MLYITIDRAGETQTRRVKPHVTIEQAKEILRNLRDNDDIGCDAWTLWNDEDIISALYPYDDEEHYTPSSTYGDYGPSNPWDAPGMSVRDFI